MTAEVAPGAGVSSRASRRCLALTFGIGLVLTASTVGMSAVPDLRFGGWQWLLVGIAGVAAALALPVHRHTWTELRSGRWGPAALGSLGLLVALAATVHDAAVGATAPTAIGVVVPAALLTLVVRWRGEESVVDVPSWFVAVLGGAAVVAGVAWAVADSPIRGLLATAAVLVAAGPAALLAASPAALGATRRRVAAHDVTLPRPTALRDVATAEVALLDKDGTVTTGGLRVTSIDPVEPDHDRNLRWFAGALEHEHDDRIARAVSRLSARGRVTEVRRHDGVGVSGRVDRHPVRVGEPTWLGLEAPSGPWTTVGVEVDARVLGTLTVADDVRDDAAEGVRALRDLGLEVVLRSGDTPERTAEVSTRVGIDDAQGYIDVDAQRAAADAWVGEGRGVLHVSTAGTLQAELGVPDLDVTRLARAVAAARAAVSGARRGQLLAMVVGALAAGGAAAGLLGPGLASVSAAVGVAATALVASHG